ncbi:LpxI family protein [Sedimentitalea sp. HM32M-2]|uniref:LpxI family protein n=1 Tax=Sedimentitalea sp. HM32M-2 TaxID=3351566 RepID=UPI00363F1755
MLALIAGEGGLPREVARHLGAPPLVCALDGFLPDDLPVDRHFRLETLGSLLADLHAQGVTEICLVGAIRRPVVDPAAIDAATLPLIPILQQAMMQGDDGALRGVIAIFEQSGFAVRAAHHIAPSLLPPPGCATARQPDAAAQSDLMRAQEVVAAMSAADVGQCCAVLAGQVLATESVFGTDWMLASLRARPDTGKGGVLYKAPKPDQDLRADLPTIGRDTIRAAAAAGLDGVAIDTGGVIVLDLPGVLAECDRLDLFLWVRDRAG